MKITVTGGTGFIGNYVINELLNQNIRVVVTGTSLDKAICKDWFPKVEFITLDINKSYDNGIIEKLASSDKLIHLIWSGLPNYKELFHFETNLMPQYFFLKKLVETGLKDITITGTCLEYGMKNGCLSVDIPSDPQNPYALAKDTLRKLLQQFQFKLDYNLKWVRLFYTYGKGQSDKSILSELSKSIINKDKSFNLSGGEQLRDYLPVEMVAKKIVSIALSETSQLVNCCSGKPVSIRSLVENYLKINNQSIQLNFGYYDYPEYEPMAFWGKNEE